MERKEYSKPVLWVEKFMPNDFIAQCNLYEVKFTSGSFKEYTTGSNHLYWDKPPANGRYDSGEQVGASSADSDHTIRVDLSANIAANYMMLNNNNVPVVRNLVNQGLKFYEYYNNKNSYPSSGPQIVAALIDYDANVTRYFNSNTTKITKLNMS